MKLHVLIRTTHGPPSSDLLFRSQNDIQSFLQIQQSYVKKKKKALKGVQFPKYHRAVFIHMITGRFSEIDTCLLFFSSVCLKGKKIHSKCYLADPVRKRYHAASEDCNNLGGVLGTPTSGDENDQLRDYIRQSIGPDEQVWLGLNDMLNEGAWVDQTGLGITYKNWDTSNSRSPQPDGGPSQNCAILSGASGGKWFDENCREEKPSVCQFNIV